MSSYDSAFQRTSRGKTTGPASRMLSWINLHIYILIIVTLIKDQFYVPLVILVILALTRIAPLAMLGGAIYFAIIQYWTGVGFLGFSFLVGILSVRFGMRFNEKIVRGQSAVIDPFENMPETGIPAIIELIAFGIALLTSGVISVIVWIVFVIGVGFLLMRYSFRLQSGWARLYYPLMLRYSAQSAEEAARAKLSGIEYSMENVLPKFVYSVYPSFSQQEIEALIDSARMKLHELSDRESLKRYLQTSKNNLSQEVVDDLISRVEQELQDQEGMGAKLLRFVIAEIVTREYGESERIKLVAGMITGRIV